MLNTLKTYLLFGKNYCGIEHNSNNGVSGVLLQKKKNELIFNESFEVDTIDDAIKSMPKKQHAFLVLNTKDVISKTIDSNEKEGTRLLYNAFPNLKINDFYYEIISYNSFHVISICRKSVLDDIINSYNKHNISIVGFSLGNTIVSTINEFIDADVYFSSNAQILKNDNAIVEIKSTQELIRQKYNINGLEVSSKQLLPFAGVLSYILNARTSNTNFEEKNNTLLTEFGQKRFFSQFIMYGLGLLLLILLINFFFFNSYYEKVNQLQQTSQVNSLQKEKLLQLKKTTDEKQKLVDDVLKNASSRSSFYIDAIANSLPKTIQLSSLHYQPLAKALKKEKPSIIDKKVIIITGTSTDSDSFSNWIYTLERLKWVENVTVINYGSKSRNGSDFGLKIQMTP